MALAKPIGRDSGLSRNQVYGFAKQSRDHVLLKSAPGEGPTVANYLRQATPVAANALPVAG